MAVCCVCHQECKPYPESIRCLKCQKELAHDHCSAAKFRNGWCPACVAVERERRSKLPKAKHLMVFLADDEWGNDKMREVAVEAFAADPSLDVVEVQEHAGWFLAWNREMKVVATANDMASGTRYRRAFWAQFNGSNLQVVRRDKPEPPSVAQQFSEEIAALVCL